MTEALKTIDLTPLDLAALLCSRVCHDAVGPVGAIVNGLELLDEDDSAETREMALELIRKSARQASARCNSHASPSVQPARPVPRWIPAMPSSSPSSSWPTRR